MGERVGFSHGAPVVAGVVVLASILSGSAPTEPTEPPESITSTESIEQRPAAGMEATTEAGDASVIELAPGQAVAVAGTGEPGYSGDGGPATEARLGRSLRIAVGGDGVVYIADREAGRVRAVDNDGTIDTVVHGTAGFTSDDCAGEEVERWQRCPRNRPRAVAVDTGDRLYVADTAIRMAESPEPLDPDDPAESEGIGHRLTTIAGAGELESDEADGGPGTDAWIYDPVDLAVDAAGDLYIAGRNRDRIWRLDSDGVIDVVAGGGELDLDRADGELATDVALGNPYGLAVDSAGRVLFTLEDSGRQVFGVEPDGRFAGVVAGAAADEGPFGEGGPATEAILSGVPMRLAVDTDDNLYLTDHDVVLMVDTEGAIHSVGAISGLRLDDVAVGPEGDVYVATEAMVWRIARSPRTIPVRDVGTSVDPDPERTGEAAVPGSPPGGRFADLEPGTVEVVAGTGAEPDEPDRGRLLNPNTEPRYGPRRLPGLAVDPAGVVYASWSAGGRILRIDPDRTVDTVDTASAEFEPERVAGLAVGPDGELYAADSDGHRIHRIGADGGSEPYAGDGTTGTDGVFGAGGPATEATLTRPGGVAVGAGGHLYIADTGNDQIQRVDPDGTLKTVAGTGGSYLEGDGGPAVEAELSSPSQLAVDSAGAVYVADSGFHSIRRIDPDGRIDTIAGPGDAVVDVGGFTGDGGPAARAELNTPHGLAVDADDNLYVADAWNNRVRRITPDGRIETVAGTGERGAGGDGGPADEAQLDEPEALAIGADGTLYIADAGNDRIRTVDPDGRIDLLLDLDAVTELADPDSAVAGIHAGAPATGVDLEMSGQAKSMAFTSSGELVFCAGDRSGGDRRQRVDTAGRLWTEPASIERGHPRWCGAVAVDGETRYVVGSGRIDRIDRIVPGGGDGRSDRFGPAVTVAGGVTEQWRGEDTAAGGPRMPARPATTVAMVPRSVVVSGGDLVFVENRDGDDVVHRLEPDGTLTRLARFDGWSRGLAMDPNDPGGAVYVAAEQRIARIEPDGTVDTVAGHEPDAPTDDSGLDLPSGLAIDDGGRFYVADTDGIKRVYDGAISLIVPAEATELGSHHNTWMAFDPHGNLHIADPEAAVIRVLVRPAEIAPVDDPGAPGRFDGLWRSIGIAVGVLGFLLALPAIRSRTRTGTGSRPGSAGAEHTAD